jgi:hypothetical protein
MQTGRGRACITYYVAGPPSAAVQELAPLAVLSFLMPSRHTRRSTLSPGYRGGLAAVREIWPLTRLARFSIHTNWWLGTVAFKRCLEKVCLRYLALVDGRGA